MEQMSIAESTTATRQTVLLAGIENISKEDRSICDKLAKSPHLKVIVLSKDGTTPLPDEPRVQSIHIPPQHGSIDLENNSIPSSKGSEA